MRYELKIFYIIANIDKLKKKGQIVKSEPYKESEKCRRDLHEHSLISNGFLSFITSKSN